MHVVILSPAGLLDDGSLPNVRADDDVTLIAWDRSDAPERAVLLRRPAGWSSRVARWAQPTVVGRVLLRLTPWDPALVFHRAVRGSATARGALRAADVLVAPERDGAYSAWKLARNARRAGRELPSVFGYPAARATIERLR